MFGASAYCYGIPSAIDPEKKRIILNSKAGTDHHLLSLINAACTIKQEKNGVGNSPEIMAIRKADSIVTQMRYIEEGQEHIRDTFWRYRNANMNSVYHVATDVENVRYDYESEEYVSKSKKDRAYSACVDFFLDDVLGEKVPSAETIANVCRGFNGESYYNSDNWFSRDGKKEMDSARNAEHWKRYYKHTPNVYLEKEAFEYEERTKAVNKVLSTWEGNKSHKARLAEQKERLIQQKAIQLAKMKQGGR